MCLGVNSIFQFCGSVPAQAEKLSSRFLDVQSTQKVVLLPHIHPHHFKKKLPVAFCLILVQWCKIHCHTKYKREGK